MFIGIVLAAALVADVPGIPQGAGPAIELPRGVAAAKGLIVRGRAKEARTLLEQLAAAYPDSNDILFMLGLLAVDSAEYGRAVRYFRAILIRQPSALRVRLELARAFYLDGDYENAFRNFQFARAGKLAPPVAATIDRFLGEIRQRKDWSYNVSLAVTPDSNINNATSAEEAVLFGLPFRLSEETRQRSGVGLSIDLASEFAPRIARNTRLRFGAAVQRREYAGTEFDDMTVAIHSGPRLIEGKWDLSLVVTGNRRWLARSVLNEGLGLRAEAAHYFDARTVFSVGAAAQRLRFPHYPLQNGDALFGWLGVVRALTPASSANARISVGRRTARASELANWSGAVSVGYYRDISGGFSVYAEPGYAIARNDAVDPFFGTRRKDRVAELRLALLNRRIVLSRFTPRLALTLARRRSNIDLYNFNQRRVELGLTSRF